MIPSNLSQSKILRKPGIYIFKSEDDCVLYVGKAVDLQSRVSSYFSKRVDSPKTASLAERIRKIETTVVESELEALILEANLIKKYSPPYNIRLTDDKDFLYIAITKEDFPKVITARKQDLGTTKEYFGPFPSSRTVKETLKSLRKIFPWCSNPMNNKKRACFYYHLGFCPGACIGVISKEDYRKIINRFSKFLRGEKDNLLKELGSEMEAFTNKEQFEEAVKIKKVIDGISYLTQTNRVTSYLDNPNFLEDETKQALKALKNDLNLTKLPERIEGYDISNIQGSEATGSLVVLTSGEIDKSQYRKFKIKISGKPNDYAMHAEMIQRRLNHPEWSIPNLIIVDGGRGQARKAKEELDAKDLKIPVYGLAKRLEWLYPPEGSIVKLPKRSLALRLLQRLRDEAHRFAISYHRKLRSKSFLR